MSSHFRLANSIPGPAVPNTDPQIYPDPSGLRSPRPTSTVLLITVSDILLVLEALEIGPLSPLGTPSSLSSVLTKRLVTAMEHRAGGPRFRMFSPIRFSGRMRVRQFPSFETMRDACFGRCPLVCRSRYPSVLCGWTGAESWPATASCTGCGLEDDQGLGLSGWCGF